MGALDDVMNEIKEYRACKNELKNYYFDLEDHPPMYYINIVNKMLKENYVQSSNQDCKGRLRRISYEHFKIKLIKGTKEMLNISNYLLYILIALSIFSSINKSNRTV